MKSNIQMLPSNLLVRIAFFRTYIRVHLFSLILVMVRFLASAFKEEVKIRSFLLGFSIGLCILYLAGLFGVCWFFHRGKVNAQILGWSVKLATYCWIYGSQYLLSWLTSSTLQNDAYSHAVWGTLTQILLVYECLSLFSAWKEALINVCLITLTSLNWGRRNETVASNVIEKVIVSMIGVATLMISLHIPKKSISEVEAQTEGVYNQNVAGGEETWQKCFQSFPYPAFLLDMYSNAETALPPVLNTEGEKLAGAGKYSDPNAFFDTIFLEVATCPASDMIRKMRRQVEQDCFHRDQVTIYSMAKKTAFDITLFTFDINKKHSAPLSPTLEYRPSEAEKRFLGIFLIPCAKDPIEEKLIMKNFKASLICSLSHELSTPLNTISNVLKLMPPCMSSNGKKNLKEIALSNSELLNSKVQDIIDYTQIELQAFKPREVNFSVNDLFQELGEIFKYEVEEKKNRLSFKVLTAKVLNIAADKERIRQVLIKLIGNSNKYTSQGLIKVTAREKNNFSVLFKVKDTGVGISKQQLELLFSNISERERIETKQKLGTTKLSGLGLAIARKICEGLNSHLKARSIEKKGSEFFFEMPTCQMLGGGRKGENIDEFDDDFAAKSKLTFYKMPRQRSFSHKKNPCNEEHSNIPKIEEIKEQTEEDKEVGRALKSDRATPKINKSTQEAVPTIKQRRSQHKIIHKASFDIDEPISKLTPKGMLLDLPLVKPSTHKVKSGEALPIIPLEGHESNPKILQEKKRVVLVVDDYAGNRLILVETLQLLNVQAIEAENGKEACKLVARALEPTSDYFIDLILMDIDMPVMDGIQATQKIRDLESKAKKERLIPIVAVTAFNGETERQGCEEAGMQHFIPKPVKKSSLLALVKKYCRVLNEQP